MPDIVLTFYCAAADRDAIADRLRTATGVPLHARDEAVLGRDFSDAHAGEQVRGALRRVAIDLVVEEGVIDSLVQTVEGARRGHPVRWQAVPVLRRGRIA